MSVTDQRKEGVQKVKNCRRHLSTAPKKDGAADVGGNFTLRRQNGTWREEEEGAESESHSNGASLLSLSSVRNSNAICARSVGGKKRNCIPNCRKSDT